MQGNVRCKGHRCEIDQDIKSLIAAAMPLDVEVETCGVVMMMPVNGSTAAHRATTVRRDVVQQLIVFHRETMSENGPYTPTVAPAGSLHVSEETECIRSILAVKINLCA